MKKILYIITLLSAIFFASCSDDLETNPTDMVSGSVMLETSEGGQAVMNGIYRAMYSSGWGIPATQWSAENSGIMAYTLFGDLMAEDHVQRESGQGWFYWDYAYGVGSDWTVNYGRQYQVWNFFYTIISNANMVIGQDGTWADTPYTKAVLGQAYAMRAFSYYFLIQYFQQAYVEGKDLPGVPIYTKPTTKETPGAGRGTVEDVYTLMNSDIDKAVEYLEKAKDDANSPWTREHESYVDYYVANGIKARIALAQGVNYTRVLDGAKAALSRDDAEVLAVSDFLGWNKKTSKNALWAIEVIASQSEHFEGFFSHMDADVSGMYAAKARQLIATGLYNRIPDTDDRKKQWWRGVVSPEQAGNSMVSYCQLKFRFANPTTRIGDYLIMRVEEMLLMAAEAECRLDNYPNARNYLLQLGEKRDTNYATRLAGMTNAKTYSTNTLSEPATLLEEILFQRRVELWGEFPRLFDLKRLQLGYDRTYAGSNHVSKLAMDPADVQFVLAIPRAEFDGNDKMSLETDQNPM